jgi:hypothetical protein
MDNTPRVSVITSVYNGLPYLPEAVESILDQSLSDYEYLVVDDGSTDGSWDVLTELARRDRRMRLLRNPANAGFARSQNRALESACGWYVACQDQDDISEPTRLERQVAFLEAHPEVGALGTWPAFIDEGGRPLANGRFPLLADNESLQRQLILGFGFVGPSLLARRTTLIDLGGYNPEMSAAEDYDLLQHLAGQHGAAPPQPQGHPRGARRLAQGAIQPHLRGGLGGGVDLRFELVLEQRVQAELGARRPPGEPRRLPTLPGFGGQQVLGLQPSQQRLVEIPTVERPLDVFLKLFGDFDDRRALQVVDQAGRPVVIAQGVERA